MRRCRCSTVSAAITSVVNRITTEHCFVCVTLNVSAIAEDTEAMTSSSLCAINSDQNRSSGGCEC